MPRPPHPAPAPGALGRDLPPRPGVTLVEGGADVAVYAGHADGVEVCLFEPGDAEGTTERRVPLLERAHGWWFGFVPGMGPGQRYDCASTGEWEPDTGHAAQPRQAAPRPLRPGARGRGHAGAPRSTATSSTTTGTATGSSAPTSTAGATCRAASSSTTRFDWEDDRPPGRTRSETVIYEAHVRNQTALHPDVPAELRGTYAGLAHPASVAHLPGWGHRGRAAPGARVHLRAAPRRRGTDQPLGLQHPGVLRTARGLRHGHRPPGRRRRGQGHGQAAAPRGHRGDPRRRLQPHRRAGRHRRARCRGAGSTSAPTTGSTSAAATSTSPAAGTPSTCATRWCAAWSWTRSATGCRSSTSTGSGSTSPWRSGADEVTTSTPTTPSSSPCAPTRCSPP